MNVTRSLATAVVMNGYIYVAGGRENDSFSNEIESFDPTNNTWSKLAPMNKCRYSFALIHFNGFLYAIGGISDDVEKYDPSENRWTLVSEIIGKRRTINIVSANTKSIT